MKPALLWLEATRPKTLLLSVMPVLIGTSFAVHQGKFSWIPCLMTLLTALLIQIGTNFANDYFDHAKGTDTPARLGPVRVTQAGLIAPGAMRCATAALFLAA